MRKGYVSTSVCHSVHSGVWQTHTHLGRPPPLQRGRHPSPGRQPLPGQTPSPPPGDGHCSGLYASYWNVFLFNFMFFFYKVCKKRLTSRILPKSTRSLCKSSFWCLIRLLCSSVSFFHGRKYSNNCTWNVEDIHNSIPYPSPIPSECIAIEIK